MPTRNAASPWNSPSPRRRAATLDDVARKVGVSAVTVSNVLNGKRRLSPHHAAIARAVRKLNFQPNTHAQRLSRGRCENTIDVFRGSLDFGVATLKVRLLQGLLAERGYQVPIHVCGYNATQTPQQRTEYETQQLNALRRQKPLAIVCDVGELSPETLRELEAYCEEGGFAVCYDRETEIACDGVIFDREHNTYTATRHLLELGHRDIGFFPAGSEPDTRLEGFRRALREFGGRCLPSWLLRQHWEEARLSPHAEEVQACRFAEQFLKLKRRPTALCIADDLQATILIALLQEAGVRVPHDLSIVSQDDVKAISAFSAVPLTTVSQPMEAIVHNVVELLTHRLSGEYSGVPRHVVVQGELVIRRSAIALK
jgi:DNA-binding LacI/PurR family transcriptional regulator